MSKVNVEKMSKKTGISIAVIERVLRIEEKDVLLEERLDRAETFEEIKKVYQEAFSDSGFEMRALWKLLEKANTIKEIKWVYNETLDGSETEKKALEKWLEKVETIKEIEEVYHETPDGSEIEIRVLRKLLDKAKTIKEIRNVCNKASSVPVILIEAILEFSEFFKE